MKERESFEATYRALYPLTCENTPDKFEWLVDHYSDSTVHVAWRLWQARAALVAQPVNADSVPGSPPGSGAQPDEPKLPESGGGSSIGLGAEGEQ